MLIVDREDIRKHSATDVRSRQKVHIARSGDHHSAGNTHVSMRGWSPQTNRTRRASNSATHATSKQKTLRRRGNLAAGSDIPPTPRAVEREATDDFWRTAGDYIYRHPVAPRGQLYVSQEWVHAFPNPHETSTKRLLMGKGTMTHEW